MQRLNPTAGTDRQPPPAPVAVTVTATPAQPAVLPAAWSAGYRGKLAGMLSGADAAVAEVASSPAATAATREKKARLALAAAADAAGLVTAPFDWVALALTVPLTFPVEEVTVEQARGLIAGNLTDWRIVGGPAGFVSVVPGESLDEPELIRRMIGGSPATPRSGGLPIWLEVGGVSQPTRKALRVGGHLPDDEAYPLVEERVVAGQSAERRDVEALARGMRALLGAARPATVTLDAVGDIMLGRGVLQVIAERGPNYPFEAVRPLLAGSDLRLGNLELALTDGGAPVRKDYVFRAPPAVAAGLKFAGFNLLTLANNHALDYGVEGLLDTMAALERSHIMQAGAGHTPEEAHTPRILTVNGLRIAVLAYLNVPNDSLSGWVAQSFAAAPGRPGIAWGTSEAVRRDVAGARAGADLVVVALHSGFEYTETVNTIQRGLARAAVDAGAALVLGAHPHVLQGIEFYKGVPVVYSLGNFVFDLDNDDRRQPGLPSILSMILRVTLTRDGVRALRILPVVIDQQEGRPIPVSGADARPVYQRLYRLTDALAAGG